MLQELTNLPWGLCPPAVTELDTSLTFNNVTRVIQLISEIAKLRLKKHSIKTTSKWHS